MLTGQGGGHVANPWLSMGDSPRFIAECDRAILDEQHVVKYQLRCDLLSHAWIGDPKTARALLLQLNPGFAESDIDEEARIPAYRPIVRKSLVLASDTGFWALDDGLRETGAAAWWRSRLDSLLCTVDADTVRCGLAVVELLPIPLPPIHVAPATAFPGLRVRPGA